MSHSSALAVARSTESPWASAAGRGCLPYNFTTRSWAKRSHSTVWTARWRRSIRGLVMAGNPPRGQSRRCQPTAPARCRRYRGHKVASLASATRWRSRSLLSSEPCSPCRFGPGLASSTARRAGGTAEQTLERLLLVTQEDAPALARSETRSTESEVALDALEETARAAFVAISSHADSPGRWWRSLRPALA